MRPRVRRVRVRARGNDRYSPVHRLTPSPALPPARARMPREFIVPNHFDHLFDDAELEDERARERIVVASSERIDVGALDATTRRDLVDALARELCEGEAETLVVDEGVFARAHALCRCV